MQYLLTAISRVLNRVVSTKQLTKLELMVLNAWRGTLSENAKKVLDAQLAEFELLQRQAAGAKICFYYPTKSNSSRFDTSNGEQHVANVVLTDQSKRMHVKIYLVDAKLFSIEFPKRPERYLQMHDMRLENLTIGDVKILMSL